MARLVDALAADENQVAAKAILLLLLTGARRNEVTHAKWEYIDLAAGTLFVPMSKLGKPRYVILFPEAIQVLNSVARLPGNPYVFPSPVTGLPARPFIFPGTASEDEPDCTMYAYMICAIRLQVFW